MITPNYREEPWKHPAAWETHLVRMTREYLCDVPTNVATCQCGWAACVRVDSRGAGHNALDDAVHGHWRGVIAEADAVPA